MTFLTICKYNRKDSYIIISPYYIGHGMTLKVSAVLLKVITMPLYPEFYPKMGFILTRFRV